MVPQHPAPQSPRPHRRVSPAAGRITAVLVALAGCAALHAQTPIPYKVVGADGRVTYTDRPTTSQGRVTPVATGDEAVPAGNPPLPLELRQAVARYPVTLYVTDADCEPCASARQLLRQRGIPFNERQVLTDGDGQALERLTGGHQAPTLAIGSQILRGLAPDVWTSYLDAAGYPRDSRLPAGYQYPPATPLVARASATAAPAAASSPAPDDEPTLPNLPNASGIRF